MVYKRWNQQERELVQKLSPYKTDEELFFLLNQKFTLAAVRKYRQRLGIKKDYKKGRRRRRMNK